MPLSFITSNKNKFTEVRAIIPDVEMLNIDLLEIQDIDPKVIIEAKLREASKHYEGEFMVEDTSLYLECLNGLPGPLIKWFLKEMGNDGLANLTEKLGDNRAEAKTIVGYARITGDIHFFEGSVEGTIVAPAGPTHFGWDPIFKPNGFDKTFAEMTIEEKNDISMRKIAVEQLSEFLQRNSASPPNLPSRGGEG